MLFVWCILLLSCIACQSKMILRENAKFHQRNDYRQVSVAAKESVHEFTISLKQKNLDVLKQLLTEVADMNSDKYGQYLTQEEIGRYVRNDEAYVEVKKWLSHNDVSILSECPHGECIKAIAPIRVLERMFECKFHVYHYTQDNMSSEEIEKIRVKHSLPKQIVRASSYSLPDHIDVHVSGVFKLINIPPPLSDPNPTHLVTVGGLDQTEVTMDDLENNEHVKRALTSAFYMTPSILKSMYNIVGSGNGYGSQAVYESIGAAYLPSDLTYFQRYFNLPEVNVSTSYNTLPSNEVCKVTSTIHYCGEASLDLQYMMGVSGNIPTTYYYDPYNSGDFLNWIYNISAMAEPPLVHSISYGTYEYYLTASELDRFNDEAIKLALRGITIIAGSGDDGVTGYLFRTQNTMDLCGYYAMFPASSPYVTALGGTMGGNDRVTNPEVGCSVSTGGSITTGGGFSHHYPYEYYQDDAVNTYFSQFNSTNGPVRSPLVDYYILNRAYPDISLAADKYIIVINKRFYSISGTSASAPVFGGMVSLVNDYRLANGLPPLGFLNPAIYSFYYHFVNDIISGENKCTANPNRCCELGFKATSGWDPVTGHGSIDFTRFFNFFATFMPTMAPTSEPTQPTSEPTFEPTSYPTFRPTPIPTRRPTTRFPTAKPSSFRPTAKPTATPSAPTFKPSSTAPSTVPTSAPSAFPSNIPSGKPTSLSTANPSNSPTNFPTAKPSVPPSGRPTEAPTNYPTAKPTTSPTNSPTATPSQFPTNVPTYFPTNYPTVAPTHSPTNSPTNFPTNTPTSVPSLEPTSQPSQFPTANPSNWPSANPTLFPTQEPTNEPTTDPSFAPTMIPTARPSYWPTKAPRLNPTPTPTKAPRPNPTRVPTKAPIIDTRSNVPSRSPVFAPTATPTNSPVFSPTAPPSKAPRPAPTRSPTVPV